ncbi:MAG TPA: asparagine--tRNA ligase [Chloroflexia bacterium]|nr:asparagine--tRNA ligase [Chloroflexia bacterium]
MYPATLAPTPAYLPRPELSRALPSGRQARIARVKSALLRAAYATLDREGFVQVMPSTLTTLSGACGEPGTLIPVSLNGERSYLRQTAQLHLEPLMRMLGRVYSIGPSFRAERADDERHLTEFTLLEAEAAGMDLQGLMDVMESLVASMVTGALQAERDGLLELGANVEALEQMAQLPFARVTYDEAIVALQDAGYFIEWGEDLRSSHELALTEIAGGPLFVTHYPLELRFFTMKVDRSDPRRALCCDLLLPRVGEVMGASETECDPAVLEGKLYASKGVRQIEDLGGSATDYAWYIEMHKQSSGQQAGFGMGFERLVRAVCGLSSVAECV